MIHVTLPQLCAYIDGELAEASAELVRRHLSVCLECTERFATLEAQDETLLRILGDDPDEEFFQSLSASIPLGTPASVESAAAPTKPSRPRGKAKDREGDRASTFSYAPTAWIAAAVCCIVAGSAAWVALRPKAPALAIPPMPAAEVRRAPLEAPPPVELDVTPETASEPTPEPAEARSPEPPSEPVAVIAPEPVPAPAPSLAVAEGVQALAPAVEHVIPPSRKPKPTPAPEPFVERAPQHFLPVRTIITETIVPSQVESSAPSEPPPAGPKNAPDPSTAALRDARSASLEAARSKLPASFDKSADAWERALPLVEQTPEALALARREVAQSRFQAWAAEPTEARRESAIASARHYLLYAAPGPERDQAWTWLGRLKH